MSFFKGFPVVVGGPTDIHDSALNKLGTIATDNNGVEYIYLQGVASTVAGDAVTYDEAFATLRLTSTSDNGPVAAAVAAVVANKFGWYAIGGSVLVNVAALFADNALCFSTATPGVIDDAIVADKQILGAISRSAISSGQATIQLNRPWIGDTNGA
jgi:hypothetical protein